MDGGLFLRRPNQCTKPAAAHSALRQRGAPARPPRVPASRPTISFRHLRACAWFVALPVPIPGLHRQQATSAGPSVCPSCSQRHPRGPPQPGITSRAACSISQLPRTQRPANRATTVPLGSYPAAVSPGLEPRTMGTPASRRLFPVRWHASQGGLPSLDGARRPPCTAANSFLGEALALFLPALIDPPFIRHHCPPVKTPLRPAPSA